jgi:hypothetical protein
VHRRLFLSAALAAVTPPLRANSMVDKTIENLPWHRIYQIMKNNGHTFTWGGTVPDPYLSNNDRLALALFSSPARKDGEGNQGEPVQYFFVGTVQSGSLIGASNAAFKTERVDRLYKFSMEKGECGWVNPTEEPDNNQYDIWSLIKGRAYEQEVLKEPYAVEQNIIRDLDGLIQPDHKSFSPGKYTSQIVIQLVARKGDVMVPGHYTWAILRAQHLDHENDGQFANVCEMVAGNFSTRDWKNFESRLVPANTVPRHPGDLWDFPLSRT